VSVSMSSVRYKYRWTSSNEAAWTHAATSIQRQLYLPECNECEQAVTVELDWRNLREAKENVASGTCLHDVRAYYTQCKAVHRVYSFFARNLLVGRYTKHSAEYRMENTTDVPISAKRAVLQAPVVKLYSDTRTPDTACSQHERQRRQACNGVEM
jgi:hypothetical protein